MDSSQKKPFFTVGLPTYNRPEYFRMTLESCLKQDYPSYEVIVSDDSKDDQIRDIVDSFGSDKVRYVKNDPPLGIPAKLNDITSRAAGPWMLMVGDDDLLEPDFLSRMAAIIEEHSDAAMVRSRFRLIDEEGKALMMDVLDKSSMSPYEFMTTIFRPWYKMRISITGFVFPLENLKRIGGFLDFYQGHCIDRVAWAMLAAQGTTYFDPEPLVSIRLNPDALSLQFIPDYKMLLDSKERIYRTINELFDGLDAGARDENDRSNMRRARVMAKEFIIDESEYFLDKILVHLLKQKKIFVGPEVKAMMQAVRASEVPFLSLLRFRLFSSYGLCISILPEFFRRAALSVVLKIRHAHMILFPPPTFSVRETAEGR